MREDWIECKLEECSLVLNNLRKPINSSDRQNRIANKKIEELFPYYGATGQVGYIDDYLTDGEFVLLGEDAAPFLEPTKDVAYLIQGKTWVNNHAHILSSLINNKFLLHYLNQFNYKDYVSGTTRLKLTQGSLKSIPVKLAPLPEQRAIVKKLESLFSSLDAGVADLKKAQQQLKIYRQAVLKKAFEGELTNTISKVEVVRLGSIIEKPKYGTSKKCTTEPIGKAVLRIPNINVGKINSEELKYAEFEDAEISALSLREGDILTIRSNGSVDIVGRCALISKKDTDFLYAGYLIRLRPNLEKANPKYLVHCLNSHNLRVQIEFKAKSTSGVNNINAGELESLEIPLFSLNEQNEIVKQIESRLSVCDSIEQNIKESLEKAEALRQSILKKAFEGNLLTAQELAECKLAEDYEPAGVLLERIKAEQIQSLKSEKKLKTKKDNHDRII